MRKRIVVGLFLILLCGVAGCGDSPMAVYREALAMQNEVGDTMTMTNEENAHEQAKRINVIQKRWLDLVKRAEKMFNKMESEKEKDEIRKAYIQFFDQFLEARMRFAAEQKRLKELADRIRKTDPTPASWVREMSAAGNRFNLNMMWHENPFNITSGGPGGPPMGPPAGGPPPGGPAGGGPPGGKQ